MWGKKNGKGVAVSGELKHAMKARKILLVDGEQRKGEEEKRRKFWFVMNGCGKGRKRSYTSLSTTDGKMK